jgi:hypothetical protein
MATYRIGQRVKKIRDREACDYNPWRAWCPVPVGALGVVEQVFSNEIAVIYDGYGERYCKFYMIAPLTDPRAEAFIGDMNRFASIAKQTVRALSDSDLEQVKGGA